MALGDVTASKIDNTITLNKEGQSSVRIIYGNHITVQDPEQVFNGSRNLFLETGSNHYLKNPAGIFNGFLGEKPYLPQYSKLLPDIQKQQVQVYFGDLPIETGYVLGESIIPLVAEGVLGAYLLSESKIFSPINNRREFLTRGGKAILGLWGILPAITKTTLITSMILPQTSGASLEANRFSDTFHPELGFGAVTLRNVLHAHKVEWVLSQERKKPATANVIFGAGHTVEWPYIVGPEKRLEFIERCIDLNVFKMLNIPNEYLYKCVRFTSNGKGNLEQLTFEVPDLKKLAS